MGGGVAGLLASCDGRRVAAEPRRLRRRRGAYGASRALRARIRR